MEPKSRVDVAMFWLSRGAVVLVLLYMCFVLLPWMLLFSPPEFDETEKGLTQFLETCPDNELRIERYYVTNGYQVSERITVNFTDGKLSINTGGWSRIPWTTTSRHLPPYAGSGRPYTGPSPWLVAPGELPTSYDEHQLSEIKSALSVITAPETTQDRSYRFFVHLAFWREKQLCIYHYPVDNLFGITELSKSLGMWFWP
jgi:hypothetical protein